MNVLIILTGINCVLLLSFFFVQKQTRLTYTETMVARQIGAVTITLLALLIVGLLWLEWYTAVHGLAWIINLTLGLALIYYFLRRILSTGKHRK